MKLVYIGLGVYLLKMKEIILVISWHYNTVRRLIVTKKSPEKMKSLQNRRNFCQLHINEINTQKYILKKEMQNLYFQSTTKSSN